MVIQKILRCLLKCACFICPPIHTAIFSEYRHRRGLKAVLGFFSGFILGQLYSYCLLRKVPFPYHSEETVALVISILLGIGNVIAIQIRCITLLLLPMYCGKAGRGVLKAIVLTYVVAGPITNMGMNAKEVVRVFACSTQLSYNLSKAQYTIVNRPFRRALLGLSSELDQTKDAMRSLRDILDPIEREIKSTSQPVSITHDRTSVEKAKTWNCSDKTLCGVKGIYEKEVFGKRYLVEMEYRCNKLVAAALRQCSVIFSDTYDTCTSYFNQQDAQEACRPMHASNICSMYNVIGPFDTCDSLKHIDPGLGLGYIYLDKIRKKILNKIKDVHLQYRLTHIQELTDSQDAKETAERVTHAFEEKHILLQSATTIISVGIALLFVRIINAAMIYHDLYLTSIEYDNIYITDYFQTLDMRRKMSNKYGLLPLKKMEKNKYVDVHNVSYFAERNKLETQILKVALEVITATTFVMLDRLFYEALDVVRQYAQMDTVHNGSQGLDIDVDGTGVLANIVRKVLLGMNRQSKDTRDIRYKQCIPKPRLMPSFFFLRIYGGYLWILLLLYFNPYTFRLRRLICSYFYPLRERKRILHLYNDILKKRMKMQKTMRKKAVQTVRAHYLSGENLLSLMMRFPKYLSWMKVFPAGRMNCLICGETEQRDKDSLLPGQRWHSCYKCKCPFVYCPECWSEVGKRCLACDPSLAEMSDVDSLSDEELHPHAK